MQNPQARLGGLCAGAPLSEPTRQAVFAAPLLRNPANQTARPAWPNAHRRGAQLAAAPVHTHSASPGFQFFSHLGGWTA